jgi:multimeric flavodoxin WrbA
MAKVLVLYQSSWGHMEQMANAAADGARAGGAQVTVKRVPELMPEEVGLPYSFAEQRALDEVVGGSPYGASTIAGGKGERQPSEKDLAGARYQGSASRRSPNNWFAARLAA